MSEVWFGLLTVTKTLRLTFLNRAIEQLKAVGLIVSACGGVDSSQPEEAGSSIREEEKLPS